METEIEKQKFKQIIDGDFADVYSKDEVIICVCKSPYIPIEAFKNVFHGITEAAKEIGAFKKFVFDKRSLRSFHQPSMEWYFYDWKLQMLEEFGLQQHFKILPEQDWFKKCVEAGKHEIFKKYGEDTFAELQINYIKQIEDAF